LKECNPKKITKTRKPENTKIDVEAFVFCGLASKRGVIGFYQV
jgi:hypothetical protein